MAFLLFLLFPFSQCFHLRSVNIINGSSFNNINYINYTMIFNDYANNEFTTSSVNCSGVNTFSDSCSNNGVCLTSGKCRCEDGYTTYPKNHNPQCNYKQKKRLTAFLLSFFLGAWSGAGYWYLGITDMAIAQLMVFVSFIFVICCYLCTIDDSKANEKEESFCSNCIEFTFSIVMLALWINALVSIASNDFTDGNGATLEDW